MPKRLAPYPFDSRHNALAYGAKGDGTTNDAPAIQAALDAIGTAGGGYLDILKPGTYALSTHLTVPANTVVTVGFGVTLKRTGGTYIFRNNSTGFTNYGAPGNIHIQGQGTLDVNAQGMTGTNGAGAIAFVQCENVSVSGVTIKNVRNWHAIEYQAVRNGVIELVTATDFTGEPGDWMAAEAFQLDLNNTGDYSPCDNILIRGCTVRGYGKLAGSHATRNGKSQTNIRIIGNYATGCHHYAIGGEHWQRVAITGNTFVSCNGGVQMFIPNLDDTGVAPNANMKGFSITGNTFIGSGTQNGFASKMTACINIDSDAVIRHYGVAITGNVLAGTNSVGIRTQNALETSIANNPIWDGFTTDTSFT